MMGSAKSIPVPLSTFGRLDMMIPKTPNKAPDGNKSGNDSIDKQKRIKYDCTAAKKEGY